MATLAKRLLRGLGGSVAALAVLAVAASGYVYVASERTLHRRYDVPLVRAPLAVPTDSASLVEGRRLATLRGCYGGCHGQTVEGAVLFDEPGVARVTAPNLTRVVAEYTDAELERAIRRGVRRDGRGVFAMPSPMFYHLSDADLGRIVAFLRSVPRVEGPAASIDAGPLGRLGLVTGRFPPLTDEVAGLGPRMPPPAPADTLRLGEYLARTVCTECHGNHFEGDAEGTPALTVAAAYAPEDFARLMRTGIAAGNRVVGLMSEVAQRRFRHFTDAEIRALHAFLRARVAPGGTAGPAGPAGS